MNNRTRFLSVCTALAVCATVCSLPAQVKLVDSLGSWTAKGGTPTATKGAVILPAGAELFRTYDTTQVAIHLISQPYFSPAEPSSPSLEIGPASLTFLRNAQGGGLVLLGDKPLALPVSIALGNDGHSKEVLDLTMSFDQSVSKASLTFAGQTFALPATAGGKAITVALASGSESSWTISSMDVASSGVVTDIPSDPSSNPKPIPSQSPTDAATLARDAAARASMAASLATGQSKPAEIIARLRAAAAQTDDSDIEFGVAAIALGERLIGYSRFTEAEVFFIAAEAALSNGAAGKQKPGVRSLCLKQLAWIRSRYLRETDQATADVEAAYQLNPHDSNLAELRTHLTGRQPSS